ncbi:MAG: hypothetical protein WC285_03420 [Candidatus Gracilibacteria bacterium]|jgi:hypothetical protein
MNEAGNPVDLWEAGMQEDEAYAVALEGYLSKSAEPDAFLNIYYDVLTGGEDKELSPPDAKNGFRYYAKGALSGRLEHLPDYLAVAKEITTKFAIRYFKALKEYIEKRRSGDPEIDGIVAEVRMSSALLLRQVEGMCEGLGVPRYLFHSEPNGMAAKLDRLIDFEEVKRQTGFWDLFRNRTDRNYYGVRVLPIAEETSETPLAPMDLRPLARLNHSDPEELVPGLSARDILLFLNSMDDVDIFPGEGKKPDHVNLVAKICKDGIIDVVNKND